MFPHVNLKDVKRVNFQVHGQGNPALVADCRDTERQIIRFMGNDVPRQKALAFIACLGGSVGESDAGM